MILPQCKTEFYRATKNIGLVKQTCGAKLYQWEAGYFRALAKQHKWDINDFENDGDDDEGAVAPHSDETLQQQRDAAVAKVAELEAKLHELESKAAGRQSSASDTDDECDAFVEQMQRQLHALDEEDVTIASGEDESKGDE